MGQPSFTLIFAQFSDCEFRRMLRDRMRVRLQGAHCVSRRKGVEITRADRFQNFLELFG